MKKMACAKRPGTFPSRPAVCPPPLDLTSLAPVVAAIVSVKQHVKTGNMSVMDEVAVASHGIKDTTEERVAALAIVGHAHQMGGLPMDNGVVDLGRDLWSVNGHFEGIRDQPNFTNHVPIHRFKTIRHMVKYCKADLNGTMIESWA
eukprot:jgi/Tetstr1/449882/TSEL_036941.t1